MSKSKVCVLGLGYIGLPTCAILAKNKYHVLGVDINEDTVDCINRGEIHIVEPGLENIVFESVRDGYLKASLTPEVSDIYIICVPTPFYKVSNLPNIDFIISATKSISKLLKKGDLIILESTSPVGTTEKVAEILSICNVDISGIHIAYCPERVVPGNIIYELVNNDRIVGGINPESTKLISSFYRDFVKGKVLETDSRTAEMCKLTENSFRDVNIAFANELSIVCDKEGINVWDLINLANRHPRVNILSPGSGVGGHCIAVDPWFIVARNPNETPLIKTARLVNDYKSKWVVKNIMRVAEKYRARNASGPFITCLGLSFKPDIDDIRESPALSIVLDLLKENYTVEVVDPNIKKHDTVILSDLKDAIKKSDIIVLLVNHKEFVGLKDMLQPNTIFLNFCSPD